MKEISKIMYKKYALNKLKYDFAGYVFNRPEEISFHHLIVAHRYCKQQGLGEGYYEWNGALLVQRSSHEYAHVIEKYDYDRFLALTSEMIDENIKGYLDMQNIKAIDDILASFEREYCNRRTKKGNLIVKPEYIEQRILKKHSFY